MVTKYLHTTGIALLLSLVMIPGAIAQTTKSAYFMPSAYARNYLNPALHPDNGYVGIPVIGNVYAEATTNTFTLENFIFLYRDAPGTPVKTMTFMHKDVSAEKFLANISKHNYLSATAGTDILAMGFTAGRSYWNFHVGLRVLADVNIPRSFFELLKVGFKDQDAISTTYDLSGINVSAKAHVEVGIGYSRSFLDDRLTVGLRPKVLLGIGEFKVNIDQMQLSAGVDFWELKTRTSLEASAPGIQPKYDSERNQLDVFDFEWEGVPGYGAGVDVGASFEIFDLGNAGKLTASAAVNNIGTMKWSAKNSYHARTNETAVKIIPSNYAVHHDGGSSIEDIFDDVVDELKSGLDFFDDPGKERQGRSSSLGLNVNLGVEYALFNDKLSVGVLYSDEKREGHNARQCTVSANYRPCSWFSTSASYALLASRTNQSMGLAIHLSPRVGPALFVASDCAISKLGKQFIPLRGYNMNLQVGLTFNTGGGSR